MWHNQYFSDTIISNNRFWKPTYNSYYNLFILLFVELFQWCHDKLNVSFVLLHAAWQLTTVPARKVDCADNTMHRGVRSAILIRSILLAILMLVYPSMLTAVLSNSLTVISKPLKPVQALEAHSRNFRTFRKSVLCRRVDYRQGQSKTSTWHCRWPCVFAWFAPLASQSLGNLCKLLVCI